MIHHIRHRLYKHRISFQCAFEGMAWSFRTQPNYRVHLFLSACALVGGYFFGIEKVEYILLILTITLGMVIETINTALEQTLDCVSLERRSDIKIAKDVAAAAMLIYSFGAFLVACVIFVPHIVSLL